MAAIQPTAIIDEEWRDAPGWEGVYLVSDHGRVWSVKREISLRKGGTRVVGGRILKGGSLSGGHRAVSLINSSGKQVTTLVHRLVLEAFVGPCPEGMEACHWDDDPSNNKLENLRWGTRRENMLDRTRNGRDNNGTKGATRCARGHEFNEDNTIVYKNGHRACRSCKNATDRARRAKVRASRPPKPPRTHCKRGHLLEEPNLRRSQRPRKDCLACHRGGEWARHNDMKSRLQEVTDSYYEDIMSKTT